MSDDPQKGLPGVAVDAHGGTVVDPTKNVEDLVRAEAKKHEELRVADQRYVDGQFRSAETLQNLANNTETKFQNFAREASDRLNKALLDAETRRIDQLAQTRQQFQDTIRDMLAESVRTTSTLVSTQLVQIQATFDTRVSKLEAYQFTQAGKSSVADPAQADAMTRIYTGISSLAGTTNETMTKIAASNAEAVSKLTLQIAGLNKTEFTGEGRRMGQGQVIAWIVAGLMLLAAVAGPLLTVMAMKGH